jgi:hypothetical protein
MESGSVVGLVIVATVNLWEIEELIEVGNKYRKNARGWGEE